MSFFSRRRVVPGINVSIDVQHTYASDLILQAPSNCPNVLRKITTLSLLSRSSFPRPMTRSHRSPPACLYPFPHRTPTKTAEARFCSISTSSWCPSSRSCSRAGESPRPRGSAPFSPSLGPSFCPPTVLLQTLGTFGAFSPRRPRPCSS